MIFITLSNTHVKYHGRNCSRTSEKWKQRDQQKVPNFTLTCMAPKAVFCYCSKTVGARVLKFCDFYC